MNPLALLGLLGGGAALALVASKKTTSSGQPLIAAPPASAGPAVLTAAAWQDYLSAVVRTRDPEQIRAAARVLRAQGLATEASALEAVASGIEAANAAASTVQTSWQPSTQTAPQASPTVYTSPGIVQQSAQQAAPAVQAMPPALQTVVNDALAQAQGIASQAASAASGTAAPPSAVPAASSLPAMSPVVAAAEGITAHLRGKRKGQEDERRVKAYQTLAGLTADGKYGPGVARSIADSGVVPVYPLWWHTATQTADAAAYAADMLSRAARDPARSAAWTAAATPLGAGATSQGVAIAIPDAAAVQSMSPAARQDSPAAAQAQAMIDALRGKTKWNEGNAARAKVKAFQQSQGLGADGLYGPGTGEAAAMLGIVPVAPLYWSATASKAREQRVAWNAFLTGRAAVDPTRSAEWLSASVAL